MHPGGQAAAKVVKELIGNAPAGAEAAAAVGAPDHRDVVLPRGNERVGGWPRRSAKPTMSRRPTAADQRRATRTRADQGFTKKSRPGRMRRVHTGRPQKRGSSSGIVNLQFDAAPEKPDPVYARKLQELIGGAYGEMTVTMQYLFQGWSCRMPGKYKDLIMDVATEKMGHVEMIATMVARLLEGAPATATTKAAAADPVVGAVLGGMDLQQAIVADGGPLLADSNGYPWNGRYIVASATCWPTSGPTPLRRHRAGCRPRGCIT
jgi:hypothetical protein